MGLWSLVIGLALATLVGACAKSRPEKLSGPDRNRRY
jgi:hypothetical protein